MSITSTIEEIKYLVEKDKETDPKLNKISIGLNVNKYQEVIEYICNETPDDQKASTFFRKESIRKMNSVHLIHLDVDIEIIKTEEI